MANTNYKLLIQAQLDPTKIQASIDAIQAKSKLSLNFQLNQNDLSKLQAELGKLEEAGNKISKIRLFESDSGGINKAVIDYTDKLGNALKTTKDINTQVKVTKQHTIDLAKNEQDVLRIEKQRTQELQRADATADKFLAKAKNMAKTSSVSAAIGKAQEIKIAVREGDIAKVRKLNDELAIMRSGLNVARTGLQSWAQGIGTAIKRVAELALGIGLVYGALNQLKKGIQYVSELNKEMTKIQVLQAEGAQTNEQIADLSIRYNNLAKEVGATTLEVAKGSVEWLFN